MSSKRKGRSSTASPSSYQSPEEKRSKKLIVKRTKRLKRWMAEDVGLKLQRVLDKLEKLDKIEGHLNEVSASLASVEESIQFNEDDILDLKKESEESKFEINDLRKQLL